MTASGASATLSQRTNSPRVTENLSRRGGCCVVQGGMALGFRNTASTGERRLKTMRFLRFMGEGGWAMWFVLAFGLITFAAAAGFALRPDPGRRRAMRSLGRATACSILTAVS